MEPFSNTLKNIKIDDLIKIDLLEDLSLTDFSTDFRIKGGFRRTGLMIDGKVYMANYEPESRTEVTLGMIIKSNEPDKSLYLSQEKIEKFKQLKNGFQTVKVSKTGFKYKYGMGKVPFPDSLATPARTMVTAEHTISRTSHVIRDPGNGLLRLISPQEAEQINTFPANWTKLEGVTDSNRYFTMGNALVVELVKEIGKEINKIIELDNNNTDFTSLKKIERVVH